MARPENDAKEPNVHQCYYCKQRVSEVLYVSDGKRYCRCLNKPQCGKTFIVYPLVTHTVTTRKLSLEQQNKIAEEADDG